MKTALEGRGNVGVYCLLWLAAFTPDVSMLPPHDLFAERRESRQEQEWNFAIDEARDYVPHMLLEGIQAVLQDGDDGCERGRKRGKGQKNRRGRRNKRNRADKNARN